MIYVYGTEGCEYCEKTVRVLEEIGLDYVYIDIRKVGTALELMRSRGHATVPQVYNGNIHIGGWTDTKAWLKRITPHKITIDGDVQL